jgi:hypothetical protein
MDDRYAPVSGKERSNPVKITAKEIAAGGGEVA